VVSTDASNSTTPLNPRTVEAPPPPSAVETPLTPSAVEGATTSRLGRLRARIRQKWDQLKAENASPEQLGLAFGIGVFWAFSPFHGFQFLLCLASAWLFRLNKLAALLGLSITLPPVVPAVIFLGVQVGALILHQQFLPLSISQLRELGGNHLAKELLLDLLVGGLVVGAVIGTVAGLLATRVIRRQRARQRTVQPTE
jgi:uncharacterized protein (DUF2062 family)